MTITWDRLSRGARLVLSAESWRLKRRESNRARPTPSTEAAEIREVEHDAAAGLRRVRVDGHDYWVPDAMDWNGFGMLHPEVFDPNHPHYYEFEGCRLEPSDVVVDAGASEGLFTRYALDRGARVIAVEPYRPMADALRRTFAPEIASGRVLVEEVVLSDSPGEATLHVDPAQPWGAMTEQTPWSGSTVLTVPRATVDGLIAGSGWGRCDFLKMDVEGVEREVVAGAAATLRRDRPRLSIAVYHHATGYLDIRRDLLAAGLGYTVEGKGLHGRFGLIPTILHAWPTPGASRGTSIDGGGPTTTCAS